MGLLFLTYAFIAYASYVKCQSKCTAAGGGDCMSIYQCQPLLTLLNKADRTPQDVDTLRRSACGFQGSTPLVCCPSQTNQCYTPEWQLGTCVSIYSCPHLSKRLTPPVSKESLDYVQNSRCEGSDQYSVCCGPDGNPPEVKPTKKCVLTAAPPDSRSRCCGIESSVDRIFGGTATEVDQYPWLTIVEYKKGSKIRLLCGGGLISGKYVLTAGHCVIGPVLKYGTPVSVRLGEYDTTNEGVDCIESNGGGQDCTEGSISIPIERTIPHPEYDPNSSLRRNDIALLRLTQIVTYTDFIRPICLPTADETLNPPPKFTLYAAGWGAVNETTSSSNVKQHVPLPFKSLESCQPSYSSKRNVALWNKQLCAGGVGGQDSCKGDSGGPLMYYKNNNTWEFTGIVSFGPTPCGIEDIPGVYTNVFQYMPWIRTQIKP